MAYYSDQDPPGRRVHYGSGSRQEEPACGAGELRDLLQTIADHIAHADERQEAALRDMQERLVHLAGGAESVRSVVPKDLAAAFARIEDGITALAGRITPDSPEPMAPSARTAWSEGAYHPAPMPDQFDGGSEPAYGDPVPPRYQPAETYRPRGLADTPPPLKSAAACPEYEKWERGGARSLRPPYGADAGEENPLVDGGGHWDRASAEALTRLYEPDEAATPHSFSPPSHAPSSEPARARTRAGAGSAYTDEEGSREAAGSEPACDRREIAAGRDLEQRFGEIAVRLEETLASIRPESPVAAIDARLEAFEHKLGSAFHGLATRADLEKLKAIEAHVTELTRHIDGAQNQLGRLEPIEAHLTLLIEHISDERFFQLLDQRAFSDEHVAQLAEAVTARLFEREAHRLEFHPELDRLGELRGIIEQFVARRQQGDEYTISALDTIQQAVLNLLDRMEALEQAHAYAQAAAFHGADYARALPEPAPEAKAADEGAGSGAEFEAAYTPLSSESAPQTIAETPDSGGPISHGGADAALPLSASREDFLAAARRAARKASSQAVGEDADPVRPAVRRRTASGSQRNPGSRPVTGLAVATLAVVLAAGIGLTTYSIYRGTLRIPLSQERSLIAPNAEHSAIGAGGIIEGIPSGIGSGEAPASRAATAPDGSETPESAPETIIDDLPAVPHSPDAEDDTPRTRTVTGLPGGIMLDTRSNASPEQIARLRHQRALAQLSTSLGAAQAGAVSIPVALIPRVGNEPSSTAGQGQPASSRIMPPASVGPLSLRLAAANGDPSAEFEVAVRLAEGKGVKQDLKAAVSWYQRSAARGFAPAQYRLGTLYERGLGVDVDRGRAMAWYRSAAEKGNLKAMHNLAVLSASGDPANYRAAAHWFGEAAARGLADSQYNLAVLFETGRGVDRDLQQAYKWFALAARGGDKEAVRRRDRVKLMLDAAQFKSAEALVRSWKQVATEPLVNDARAAGEAWKQRESQS